MKTFPRTFLTSAFAIGIAFMASVADIHAIPTSIYDDPPTVSADAPDRDKLMVEGIVRRELVKLGKLTWDEYLAGKEVTEDDYRYLKTLPLHALKDSDNNFGISSLPKEVYQACNLERLHLSTNNFSAIPPEIGLLHNLHFLSFAKNPYNKDQKKLNIRGAQRDF